MKDTGLFIAAGAFVVWALLVIAAVIDNALIPLAQSVGTVLLGIVGLVFGSKGVEALKGGKNDE